MKSKKHFIILILKVLEISSDKFNPVTQIEIANIISEKYPCDRKTVGRNIKFLIEVGYPIVKTNKGFYLDKKKFTVDEKEFVLNAVKNSPEKSTKEKEDIVKRLEEILTKIYR